MLEHWEYHTGSVLFSWVQLCASQWGKSIQQHKCELPIQQFLATPQSMLLVIPSLAISLKLFRVLFLGNHPPTYHWSRGEFHGTISMSIGLNDSLLWVWAPLIWQVEKYIKENQPLLKQADCTLILSGIHDIVFQYDQGRETATSLAMH